jgi:hypothetical protein
MRGAQQQRSHCAGRLLRRRSCRAARSLQAAPGLPGRPRRCGRIPALSASAPAPALMSLCSPVPLQLLPPTLLFHVSLSRVGLAGSLLTAREAVSLINQTLVSGPGPAASSIVTAASATCACHVLCSCRFGPSAGTSCPRGARNSRCCWRCSHSRWCCRPHSGGRRGPGGPHHLRPASPGQGGQGALGGVEGQQLHSG